MGRRRKIGRRQREIRHLLMAYHSRNSPSSTSTCRSIKYLPYWADLEVRHAIDGMHLKKNMFGNTIELLLETSAKIKNTLKSRWDLVAMKIR
jgi:hypothetical protein